MGFAFAEEEGFGGEQWGRYPGKEYRKGETGEDEKKDARGVRINSSWIEGAQCLEDQKSSEGKSWDYRYDPGDDEGVLQEISGGEEVRR